MGNKNLEAQKDTNLEARSEKIFLEHREMIFKQTDRLFGILMAVQWLACILTALVISPRTWIGSHYAVHIHVWAAVFLGGAISLFPILLIYFRPGQVMTRYTIAVAQMLMSALLIHLTGGRIETHFHVFGSLAILAFYRDWKVMIPATIVVALDHAIRGIFFPQSVFGVLTASPWRWVEHAGWVVFENIFLIVSCLRSLREMKDIAMRQAQLQNMNQKIEIEVQKKTEELKKTRDEAISATKAKSEFLATMSHEIRTPMNAILGMGELLAEGKLDDEQKDYVETLRRNGNHLLTIINDILDLSKVEVGKLQLESIPFDLNEVVERVTELMAVRAHQKGLELLSRIDANVPRIVEGDGNRLRQILMNLVGNAIKFTEKGEVVVEVSLNLGADSYSPQSTALLFKVRDTGIGIAEDKKQMLFGAFNQLDSSTTRKYGGTGLGLSICKKLVELMHGEIGAKSRPGQGSEFHFTAIFQKSEETAIAESLSGVSELHLREKKILIVDDNDANRLILREMLKVTGAQIVEAPDGKTGLTLLRTGQNEEAFDLVLLDCRMPEMDGFDFVQHLHGDEKLKSTPIMMLTSDDRRAHVEKAKAMGLSDYLVKPIKKMELFHAIRRVLEETQQEKTKMPLPSVEKSLSQNSNVYEGLRVLLVEDNLDNRMLIQSYLKKTLIRLDTAVNGLEAFEKVKRQSYDVILMDLHMPVMDGYEASRKIREWEKQQNGTHQKIAILALSASALTEEVFKSVEAGCDQHLSKPISKEVLLKTLRTYEDIAVKKVQERKKAA